MNDKEPLADSSRSNRTLIVGPRLFPPLDFYRDIRGYGSIAVDWSVRFDKRDKRPRRYDIADVNGKLSLTVPIQKPESLSAARWGDLLISSHGNWQSVHQTALESAYGRTPYFEFYIDYFRPLFSKEWNDRRLKDYLIRAHGILSTLLPVPGLITDLTETQGDIDTHIENTKTEKTTEQAYWQPRASSMGFIGGLSILDALFCLGPETIFLLMGK